MDQNLYHKMTVFIAPKIFGAVKKAKDATRFKDIEIKTLNDQMVFEAYPQEAPCSQA